MFFVIPSPNSTPKMRTSHLEAAFIRGSNNNFILNENHDIAIAMYSSSRADSRLSVAFKYLNV